ncbi:MAG: Fic family protein [Alphaproteobacteria bacterium]|nr:Fic family protein [Alphaproteobacteria bacterium]
MKRDIQGTLVKCSITSETFEAYIPNALPPKPDIDLSEVSLLLEKANQAIGQLNGVVEATVDPSVLNYMYVRKEAVLSSQIEGTQSTLDDLLKYESEQIHGILVADASEVSSYVAALNHGLKRIKDGFPLSLRLIREIHKILLTNSRGQTKLPGEFRSSQNWIGGTRPGNARFVPVPPDKLMTVLGDLEVFMNNEDTIPNLIKAALIHVQFETIHPFLDGNGRVGRLLITLFLCVKGVLDSPFLYLSLFFKKNRSLYYDALNGVRQDGDWENWIKFFLEGVIETANDAKTTLIAIQNIFSADSKKIKTLGRATQSALKVFTAFQKKPMLTVAEIVKMIDSTKPTVIKSLNHLIDLKILENNSEKKWGQIYTYKGYTDLLSADVDNKNH